MQEAPVSWKNFGKDKAAIIQGIASIILLYAAATLFADFLDFAEYRKGIPFDDPLMSWFTPYDFSLPLFILTYGSVAALIAINFKRPKVLVQMAQLYTMLLVARTITIFLVPLEAPAGYLHLEDPFLNNFIYIDIKMRDLFFSGHVATIILFALTLESRNLRILFFLVALTIGLMVIWQHVHYSIDVIAAIPFAWIIYRLHERYLKKRLT